MALLLYNRGHMQRWSEEEVFLDARPFFSSLEKGLAGATSTIDLETYIFSNDELGRTIIELLKRAAARGVRVRVMVDGFGSPGWAHRFSAELVSAGVQARVFHPLPWRANERNHRKVCIIDHHRAWLGGMNISSAHIKWHDIGASVAGGPTRALSHAFERTWEKAWFPTSGPQFKPRWRRLKKKISFGSLVRLNATRKARKASYRDLIHRIRKAANRIWITNAYFIPPHRLLSELQAASLRRVDVRLLVPRHPDIFFIHWVSSALYYGLLNAGVRIFEYLPAPLHAKTILIDHWASVGSSNLNHRSLLLDLEVDVSLSSAHSIQLLSQGYESDLTRSQEVTMKDWRARPVWERFLGRFLLTLRRWM
ncbi:MAG: phospholipase D-like domain-containing protein [Bdellovibrionota bacterium]